MAFTDFYLQTSGSDLNAGSTADDAAPHTYASGSWVQSTGVFTPASGDPESDGVQVGDWASVYPDGNSITPFIGQVTAVSSTTITVSLSVKFGTAPADGTSNRTLKVGGAFASLAIVDSGSALNTGTTPVPLRVNIKAGTYANTTNDRRFSMGGTTTLPIWWRGYQTTPGDLDDLPDGAANGPNVTFTTGRFRLDGAYNEVSSLNIVGAQISTGQLEFTIAASNGVAHRCRIECTADVPNGRAIQISGAEVTISECWTKSVTGRNCIWTPASDTSLIGCTIQDGGIGISLTAAVRVFISFCTFRSQSLDCIRAAANNIRINAENNTFFGPGDNGIQFTNVPAASRIIGNAFVDCGDFGVLNSSGTDTSNIFLLRNLFSPGTNKYSGLSDWPSRFEQTDGSGETLTDPPGDLSLKADSNAVGNGIPTKFENQGYTSNIDIGAVQNGGSTQAPAEAELAWVGAVATTQATVVTRLTADGSARLVISESSDLSGQQYFSSLVATDVDRVCKLTIGGLSPNTQYYYGIEANGTIDTDLLGVFRTFPAGQASFKLAASSCAGSNNAAEFTDNKVSNHPVFDAIRGQEPLFFLHMGDLHYRDISSNNVETYRTAYKNVLQQQRQHDLYRSVPTVYMWDDHDYGPDNSDKTATSRPAALTVYRQYAPHYGLPSGPANDTPIYQTFVCGRVRFFLLDLRSERDPNSQTDDSDKSMLGATQKQWLKDQLLAATEPVLVIVSSVGWVGAAVAGADYWAGFTTEREELAGFFEDNDLTPRLLILSGDMHAVAMDDGTNSQYADGASSPGPAVFHFASLDSDGHTYGGPYSEGSPSQGRSRYGIIEFTDNGTSITVTGTGYEWDIGESQNTQLVTHSFAVAAEESEGSGHVQSRVILGM